MESLKACPAEATPHLLANIVAVGGCALFAGIESRLLSEIRALAPDDMEVNVTVPKKWIISSSLLCADNMNW